MGSLDVFAMIGALCAQYISDALGRRKLFQVSAIIFIFGILVMISSWNYGMLLFGRVFVGLGVGFGLAVSLCENTSCFVCELLTHALD